MSTTGSSINSITYTTIDDITISDAFPHGLGEFTRSGFMFSYKIPHKYQGRFHINFLEYLAAKWPIYLAITTLKIPHPHIAHCGDNTSAVA